MALGKHICSITTFFIESKSALFAGVG